MRPKKVGLIVFEHVAAADLTGPAEVFSRANISGGNGCESSCYNVLMLGITAQPYRTECGIVVKPHTDLASAPALDTVIIPGGTGIRNEKVTNNNREVAQSSKLYHKTHRDAWYWYLPACSDGNAR